MREWDDLVSTALLGTRRREPGLDALPPDVRRLVTDTDPAAATLTAAAALTAYRRAGRVARTGAITLPEVEPDSRPGLPRPARERLARLLGAAGTELLEEWLRAVAARGYQVPPERLPALADAARTKPALRGPVALAAGPRGRWLAGLNPEWRFLTAAAPDAGGDAWRFGTAPQRRSWLAVALAADPDGARAAVAATWASEPAEIRASVLELLAGHLRPGDEPFLESALGDRAASVRQQAAALLARLPGSAYGRRQADRLRPLLSVREPDVLVVSLPEDDGGERTRRLRQLVAAAPPEVWDELAPPERLVAMDVEGCPARVLADGWTVATLRHRDPRWARALFEADPARPDAARLLGVMAPADRAEIVGRLGRQADPRAVARLVPDLPAPWTPELGTVLLDWLSTQDDHRLVAHAAVTIARAVPPESLDHPLAVEPLQPGAAPWRRALAKTLTFRREMYEELA
ncbi:DUF5691 domain-containing protein [Amycolatopsis suaedae]|uniref:Uncharacterized protein n=1 Tax=Amycolatopsis suaedae TaxID=2510978 RepID=A0A4Q7J5R1_9PSEU|nr:DUF5691 domain-containing protein [Amycolatopsis suaedae]RZQ61334.1 hypothetical protein EWH70_23315 [Amycolatopsis suaedae]